MNDRRRGTGSSCSAIGCSKRRSTNLLSQVKMFSFPRDLERRRAWAQALKRVNWAPANHSVICNSHFITGRPSADPTHPDYVPSIFHFNETIKRRLKGQSLLRRANKRSAMDECMTAKRTTPYVEFIAAVGNSTDVNCNSQWTSNSKTVRGPSTPRMILPNFHNQLFLLTPYQNLQASNINIASPTSTLSCNVKEEDGSDTNSILTPLSISVNSNVRSNTQLSPSSDVLSSPTGSDTQPTYTSSNLQYGCWKKLRRDTLPKDSEQSTESALAKYLETEKTNLPTTNLLTDPLINFFITMAQTIKTFPPQDQIHIKGQLFKMVTNVEMRLAEETESSNSDISSVSACQQQSRY